MLVTRRIARPVVKKIVRAVNQAVASVLEEASLYLDFLSGTFDPRITFTRASNATVTGPDGTLQYAPHNLLTYSEQFDNAAWTKALCTINPNSVKAPDGTITADSLVEDTTSGFRAFNQNFTAFAGATYTISFYAKAAARSFVRVYAGAAVSWASAPSVVFDLSNGTVYSGTGGSITPVGFDGWYRCSVVGVYGATGGNTSAAIGPVLSGGSTNNYLGTGETALHVWGAQLNIGSLQPYYPTTVKNLLGFTNEFDNAAWTKSNSFVQTNLLTFSEQFDNAAWLKVRSSITQNAATAPDGAATADKLVIDTTAATNHNTGQNITVVSGATYTLSVYVKAAEFSQINLRFSAQFHAGNTTFDLSTETKTNFGTVVDSSIDPVGGGWYRCTFTQTANASGTATAQVFLAQAGSITIATANGTDGIYLWGAQLVQGSTPGDYQRTEGTARAVMYPAPDGSRTADKLVENTSNAQHFLNVTTSPATVAGSPTTIAIYAKAGERSFCRLRFGDNLGFRKDAVFNLTTGVLVSENGTGTASITSIGNGWYRLAVTGTTAATSTSSSLQFYVRTDATTETYTGDGTSGIYIWGAQLSDSASLDPYVYNSGASPAASAYYGPRFDYDPVTLQPLGFLIEEQRTNSIRNSTMQGAVAGSPGTLPTNWVYTGGGLTASVIGTGIESGIDYIDIRFSGTASATSSGLRFEGNTGVSASTGQTWTASVFARRVSGSIPSGGVAINLTYIISGSSSDTTQNALTVDGLNSAKISAYRPAVTLTSVSAGITSVRPQILLAHSIGSAVDITLRIGLPQLELGAKESSVIPTSGAAATRAADIAPCTGTNFSSWYRQDEGTFFVEFLTKNYPKPGNNNGLFQVDDGTFNNSIYLMQTDLAGGNFSGRSGGGQQWALTTPGGSLGVVAKLAGSYSANNFRSAYNGTLSSVDTLGTVPAVSSATFGNIAFGQFLNGHLRRIAFFPRAFSAAELQVLTS